jgi:hypothetical protein
MWSILQILTAAFRARGNRDWTKRETSDLFHDLQSPEVIPKRLNRTPEECAKHYKDVVGTFFECFGSSRLEGIESAVREFYIEEPKQGIFTEEETRDMMIQYLIHGKAAAREFDAQYCRVIEWVYKRLGFSSSEEAISAAINTFYKKDERDENKSNVEEN